MPNDHREHDAKQAHPPHIRSRFTGKVVSVVTACTLATGLCPAFAFAVTEDEANEDVAKTVVQPKADDDQAAKAPDAADNQKAADNAADEGASQPKQPAADEKAKEDEKAKGDKQDTPSATGEVDDLTAEVPSANEAAPEVAPEQEAAPEVDSTDAESEAAAETEAEDEPTFEAMAAISFEEAEQLAADALASNITKSVVIDGVTYKYYLSDKWGAYGAGAYIVDTSRSSSITIPQKIEGQNVVYFKTEGMGKSGDSIKLDASKATALKYLYADVPLASLNVSKNAALVSLWVAGSFENGMLVGDLMELDVRACTQLVYLDCGYNKLTSLDVTRNTKLRNLDFGDNRVESIDLSKNAALEMLDCYSNRLKALNVSANTKLRYLTCSDNYIKKLDLSKNAALVSLSCQRNELTSLDLSKNPSIKQLYCTQNRIADTKALTDRFGSDKGIVLPQLESVNVGRFSGMTALDTMYYISMSFTKSDAVVVATMDGYWDALTASALAGLHDCPIVLTEGKNLSDRASRAILNSGASKVYIAGGPAAVSTGVESAIKKLNGVSTVKRLAGDIAIDTALKIYEEGKGSWGKTAVVATSGTFQDALSVSPYAYAKRAPIFLANASTHKLDPQVLSAIKGGGFDRVVIVGGTAAISSDVEGQLSGIETKRLAGPTAYETSGAIAAWCLTEGMTAANTGVATGSSYYDALAGAALCGLNNSALVLVDDGYRTNIDKFIAKNKNSVRDVLVFGGPAAVSDGTFKAIKSAVK